MLYAICLGIAFDQQMNHLVFGLITPYLSPIVAKTRALAYLLIFIPESLLAASEATSLALVSSSVRQKKTFDERFCQDTQLCMRKPVCPHVACVHARLYRSMHLVLLHDGEETFRFSPFRKFSLAGKATRSRWNVAAGYLRRLYLLFANVVNYRRVLVRALIIALREARTHGQRFRH